MNGDTTPPAPAGINDGDWPGEFAQSGGARRIYEGDEAHHGVIDDVAALSDHGGGHAVPLIPVGKDATPASPDPGIRRAEQSETSRARGKGPRLLDRDAPFRQSYGRWNIERENTIVALRLNDWFHTIISWNVYRIVLIFSLVNVIAWVVFGGLLYRISDECDLSLDTYQEALMLAIITMSTIGYGVQSENPYLQGCGSGIVVIGIFVLLSIILDALMIGIIMQRVARGQRRASTVCFGDKAIIREIGGRVYFVLQVCEMRKHQLIEAHVRLYCVRTSTTPGSREPIPFQSFTMRLQQPNDELNGMLLLAMPQQIVHRIDAWSPLMPGSGDPEVLDGPNPRRHLSTQYAYPAVLQREVDIEAGNREAKDGYTAVTEAAMSPAPSIDAIRDHMVSNNCELLVLVEGIDAVTSYTVQARHSYIVDDVVFGDYFFAPCVTRSRKGACVIDFKAFHRVHENVEAANLHVQSHS